MQAQDNAQSQEAPGNVRPRGRNTRWGIAVLLGVGILINYFDRVNLTVATKPIERIAIGVKWLMRVGTLLWSIASFMTAVVSGLGLVFVARLILGVGEAPAFPGSSKATGYWFPISKRVVRNRKMRRTRAVHGAIREGISCSCCDRRKSGRSRLASPPMAIRSTCSSSGCQVIWRRNCTSRY